MRCKKLIQLRVIIAADFEVLVYQLVEVVYFVSHFVY
jgi:hypothetical protein